jgi:hypothetical protein
MNFYLLHNGQPSARRLAAAVPGLVPTRRTDAISADDYVIRYGAAGANDVGRWVVNRRAAVRGCQSRRNIAILLRRAGVATLLDPTALQRASLVREYRVPVFSSRALACFRAESKGIWLSGRMHEVGEEFGEVAGQGDDQSRRACLLATRAVHALALECALVSIGAGAQGRLFVLDIAPTPVLRGRLLDLYAEAARATLAAEAALLEGKVRDVQLGTDLEFMLRSRSGKLVPASRYFPLTGAVGCDDRSMAGDRSRRPLAELRPEPAASPAQLCANVASALEHANRLARHTYPTWLGGSAPFARFPIGGHVHLSGVPFTGRIAYLLDVYVGLPLMLIEDPTSAARRRPRYGFLGDIRHKPHGGFEYRTPGSFLVDPVIAEAAFALCHAVALHQHELPYLAIHHADAMQAFYRSDRDYFLETARRIKANLRRTDTYAKYGQALETVFDMIEQDEVWDESLDIRQAWGIRAQTAEIAKKKSEAS